MLFKVAHYFFTVTTKINIFTVEVRYSEILTSVAWE